MLISCPTCCVSCLSLWRKLKIEFTRKDLLFQVRSVRLDFGPLLKYSMSPFRFISLMYKHIFLASGSAYCIVNLSDPASPNCQTMADTSPPKYLQKHLSNPSRWATSWTQSAHWPPCFAMLMTRQYTAKNKTQPNNNINLWDDDRRWCMI